MAPIFSTYSIPPIIINIFGTPILATVVAHNTCNLPLHMANFTFLLHQVLTWCTFPWSGWITHLTVEKKEHTA